MQGVQGALPELHLSFCNKVRSYKKAYLHSAFLKHPRIMFPGIAIPLAALPAGFIADRWRRDMVLRALGVAAVGQLPVHVALL